MAVTVRLAVPSLRRATSYYAWPLPTVRGDKDIWGDILNTQTFAGIDAALHNNNPAATGSIDNMVIGGSVPKAATFTSMVLNTPLPIASGGTGATDAAGARASLGVSGTGADTAYCWRSNNLSDVNATTARTNLGLGTAAVKNTGTSGNTVPLLDGANTFSGASTVFDGNVGIGTAPANKLDVRQDVAGLAQVKLTNASTTGVGQIAVSNGSDAVFVRMYGSAFASSGLDIASSAMIHNPGAGGLTIISAAAPLRLGTNNTERARITADGFFKASVDGTYYDTALYHELRSNNANRAVVTITHKNNATPNGISTRFDAATPNNATQWFHYYDDSSSARCIIYSNGGIANYSANNVNLSDAELKTDITPYTDADLDALETSFKAVDWCRFKYADQTHTDWNHGYTAQGVEAAFAADAPELVDDTDLGPTAEGGAAQKHKAVYDIDLTHIAHALLARALARIADLEARLAAAGV